MKNNAVRSITFDSAAVPFLHRGYVRVTDRKMFWCVHYFHHHAVAEGLKIKLNKFVAGLKNLLANDAFGFIDAAEVIPKPAGPAVGQVPYNLASTGVLVSIAAASLSMNQTRPPIKRLYTTWLSNVCKLAVEGLVTSGDATVLVADLGHNLRLTMSSRTGSIHGSAAPLCRAKPPTHRKIFFGRGGVDEVLLQRVCLRHAVLIALRGGLEHRGAVGCFPMQRVVVSGWRRFLNELSEHCRTLWGEAAGVEATLATVFLFACRSGGL